MTLKQFCKTLQQCAGALEEELKTNLNEFHNLIFGKTMTEVKLALERAKDYHYKELTEALSEILKNVKIIVFHQDKIEWLNNETNFTASDLKRFSYVKRQVYAFSQNEEKPQFSKSVENLAVPTISKRERRRTASEVSLGTLEAWEKYLDQKEKEEDNLTQDIAEVKKVVPKRTLCNARARKKFVSSTIVGFLDDEGKRRNNLDSIVEDTDDDPDQNGFSINDESIEILDENMNSIIASNEDSLNGNDTKSNVPKSDTRQYSDLVDRIDMAAATEEDIIKEIMDKFLDEARKPEIAIPDEQTSGPPLEHIKPKIVDVIYKKKPT